MILYLWRMESNYITKISEIASNVEVLNFNKYQAAIYFIDGGNYRSDEVLKFYKRKRGKKMR